MAELVWKRLVYRTDLVPDTAYFYKKVNDKFIYKDRYTDEYYVVYRYANGYIIEKWRGECKC